MHLHGHWVEIERIGLVVTQACARCGKTRIRLARKTRT
ncbi:hypothetical protein HNR40_003658 [Nonomuraea endophytica]|uniref:Uncharacterized protein n=1 Tax=Nonomuraea endophytica TaxID=714136 RepID=A0A7W8A4M2_9ACTN|nr:hypothetical protein [Nonomuraea endophytica]